jgi:hypothetical protein
MGPVLTLFEGIGREGCVSCARAKEKGGRPLCVGASSRGNSCLCFFHCDMRNLAVRIGNIVGTPDDSRPQCSFYIFNFNMTIFKAW